MKATQLYQIILAGWLIMALVSCSQEPNSPHTDTARSKTQTNATSQKKFKRYQEQGDLNAITRRGVIRLLAPHWDDTGLPRAGLPSHGYRELAESFAKNLQLDVQWVLTETHQQLIEQLKNGYGDIIVSHLTHTPTREQQIDFSLPISSAYEQVVGPAKKRYDHPEMLTGKTIAVGSGSSFVNSLSRFTKAHPELNLAITETHSGDPDALIDQLNRGKIDATVLDHNIAESLSQYRNDFTMGLSISPTRPIAWAVRKNNPKLLAKLNAFLIESRITQNRSQTYTDDFSTIKQRKTLRMITRNSPASYFLWRGELMGYEYDLIKEFTSHHGLRLEVQVAPPEVDMISLLNNGGGDLIAASMTITPKRKAQGIHFTQRYLEVQEQLVTHTKAAPLNNLDDLNGRTLTIHPDTAYWQTAQRLLQEGYTFKLIAAEPDQTTTDILSTVARGNMDATIADSHLVSIEHKFSETLLPGYTLEQISELGWAVRKNNPELLAALNHYVKKHYRGHLFNVTYNKYFRNEKRIDKYQGQRLITAEQLSPYDKFIKPQAEQYHFDWRMLVSQMYEESKFNPKAESFSGAMGLFQVMPRTAKELGYSLPLTPKMGIYAGVRYLDWTRDRFEATLPLEERLWFALAAYNAGFGHVNDARRLARQQGWDGDIWFDNVEKAMLLLSKRQYYTHARFGYVRGSEPVNYVRSIKNRYYAYLALNN